MINRLLINSIIILLLVGCSKVSQINIPTPPITPSHTETITSTVKETSTNSPIKFLTPTRTVVPSRTATKTKQPSPSLTITPFVDFKMTTQCLEIKDQFPAGAQVEGIFVYRIQGDPPKTNINFQNLQTKHIVHLITEHNDGIGELFVSPKGKWLAYDLDKYSESDPKKSLGRYLVIKTANGQTYRIIPWKEDWGYITDWRDEEHLMISGSRAHSGLVAPLIIYDPFKNDSQKYISDFPEIDYYPPNWWGSENTAAVYDPSFTLAIYPRKLEDWLPDWPIALWDIQKNVLLALFQGNVGWGNVPRWSPDGSQVIFAKAPSEDQDDLYSLSRDGVIKQLTNLGVYISQHYIGELSWSQDGRYIAFWLYEENSPQLVIYDMGLKTAINYCIQGGINRSIPPIWLPNNRHLILSNTWEDGYSHTIFIDIIDGYAVNLGDHMIAYGWMEAIP